LSKKTFEAARDTGNILIAQIKDNQPNLHEAAKKLCETVAPKGSVETVDKCRHGRQEHRRVDIFAAGKALGPEWEGLINTVARVERLTWHKDTKSGLWHETTEISFYACQGALSAPVIADAIRQHWAIENRCNHVRDVALFEDHSRIRTKPTIFAVFRSFALNIMRANSVINISQELYANALNPLRALEYAFT
jgi:predicted transposase YbfD/YdcC